MCIIGVKCFKRSCLTLYIRLVKQHIHNNLLKNIDCKSLAEQKQLILADRRTLSHMLLEQNQAVCQAILLDVLYEMKTVLK